MAIEPFIGEIQLFGFNFAPRGWARCEGQILPIAQNTALFSLLGVQYGGNGQTTFALPDLRGRVAVGQGQGPGLTNVVMGQMAGQESVTLIQANLPAHVHQVAPAAATTATSKVPTGRVPGLTAGSAYAEAGAANTAMATIPTTVSGGSQPFGVRDPYLGLNYCIALVGIFPSRN